MAEMTFPFAEPGVAYLQAVWHGESLIGYFAGDDGSIWSQLDHGGNLTSRWRRRKGSLGGNSVKYICMTLCQAGRRIRIKTHRLIAETFLGPCPAGKEVCHENGDPVDNRLRNLRYDIRRNNRIDAFRQGRIHRHGKPVMPELVVKEIKAMFATGCFTKAQLGRAYGKDHSSIRRIITGEAFSWMTTEELK